MGFPGVLEVKNPSANAGDTGLIPGSGRSPGRGNGNPLQYSCLESPMDRGACRAAVPGVAESDTAEWLSTSPSTDVLHGFEGCRDRRSEGPESPYLVSKCQPKVVTWHSHLLSLAQNEPHEPNLAAREPGKCVLGQNRVNWAH